jgi:hypothetical protein
MISPSEELSKKILEKLVAEVLITADDAKKMSSRMAAGKLRADDWKLAIEKGSPGGAKT